MENIRNFCIIAHIDHGKSTLADRMLDLTGSVDERKAQAQILDNMDLEREKGITIKSHAVRMDYEMGGEKYALNLIDTPGHVDFSYEVSRAIASCEGALLVVDATQGVQAQTISNLYLALEHDLTIIPVLNKIDMDAAKVDEVSDEVVELLGCSREEILAVRPHGGRGAPGDGGHRAAHPRAEGRPRSAAAGPDIRLRVQLVPRDHRVLPRIQRNATRRGAGEVLQLWQGVRRG